MESTRPAKAAESRRIGGPGPDNTLWQRYGGDVVTEDLAVCEGGELNPDEQRKTAEMD